MTEKRADLKQRRDAAEKALAELPNTRPANEITAEIDALMTSRKDLDPTGLGKCVDWLPSVAARDVCAKASRLKVELPAAQKREALEVELHAARDGLAQTSATKAFANGDAAAIVSLLERAGVRASVDNVNLYLSVLLVLALELGPGIAFMLAGVFAEQTRHTPAAIAGRNARQVGPRSGLRRYKCRDCHRTFNALTGTPLAQLHRRDA